MSQHPASGRVHLPHLDGIRGTAALTVLVGHVFQAFSMQTSWYPQARVAAEALAHDAVVVFLALSGFCLFRPIFASPRSWNSLLFYKCRVARIIPPYYGAIAVYFVLFGIFFTSDLGRGMWAQENHFTWKGLWTHLGFVSHYIRNKEFNGAFWSVTLEENIYLLMPLLVLSVRRISPLLLTLLVAVAVWYVQRHNNFIYTRAYLSMVPVFLVGGVFAWASTHERASSLERFRWGWITLALAIGFLYFEGLQLAGQNGYVRNLWIALAAGSLMLSGVFNSRVAWPFTLKPLVFVGAFSYSLYLMHEAGTKIAANLWPGKTPVQLYFLSMSMALLIALAFFFAVEKPALAWRSRIKERSRRRTDTDLQPAECPPPRLQTGSDRTSPELLTDTIGQLGREHVK